MVCVSKRKVVSSYLKKHHGICTYPATIHDLTPAMFPPPQVNQWYANDNDKSSGYASYMSSCAQSYGSFDATQEDKTFYHPPNSRFSQHSYADAVKQAVTKVPTQVSKPVPAMEASSVTNIEFSATTKELRDIIVTLPMEVNQLKKGTQPPSTPLTVTEVTSPGLATVQQSSRIDHFETNVSQWMKEMTEDTAGPIRLM